MTTSVTEKNTTYGVFIKPSMRCRVMNYQSLEERYLTPGLEYYLPWRQDVIIIIEELPSNTTDKTKEHIPSLPNLEMLNWLKLAESAFKFWDNDVDDGWASL